MKKEIKDFLHKKGGLWAFLISVGLVLTALFLILVGCIYAYWGGDWGKIPEMLTTDFAIACYVIAGLTIFALFYVTIIMNRNKEIK